MVSSTYADTMDFDHELASSYDTLDFYKGGNLKEFFTELVESKGIKDEFVLAYLYKVGYRRVSTPLLLNCLSDDSASEYYKGIADVNHMLSKMCKTYNFNLSYQDFEDAGFVSDHLFSATLDDKLGKKYLAGLTPKLMDENYRRVPLPIVYALIVYVSDAHIPSFISSLKPGDMRTLYENSCKLLVSDFMGQKAKPESFNKIGIKSIRKSNKAYWKMLSSGRPVKLGLLAQRRFEANLAVLEDLGK